MAEQSSEGIQPHANPAPPPAEVNTSSVPDAASATAPITAPLPAPSPPPLVERLDKLLVLLLLILAFLVGSFAATNTDVWLYLASGRHSAEGDWTIGVDPFAYTTEAMPARPAVYWVQHSWLFSLVLYWLYGIIGGAGLVVLKALCVVALALCLLAIPGGAKDRFLAVVYVGLAILAISPQLVLRPMTLSFLFFGVTLLTCYRAGALGNVPANPRVLWRLPLLFLLWANLDAWFIMGPLTLVLLWAGAGFGLLLGIRPTFPARSLGAVLGIGLLACLVNPHHVRVFMLPPELAYPIVRVFDLPDFLGAGGRALRDVNAVQADYYPLLSPLEGRYWANSSVAGGQHVAGLAYIPLLFLGLVSIVVNTVVTKKPGAPGLHPGRFLLWAVLACLGAMQVRLIPWFAIASAPLTLLNVVDWRTWLTNIQVPNWRPALLGRALAMFLFLLLLFLAWPGWLHAPPGEFYAPRRVAWKVPVDPSFQRAALYLAERKEAGRETRILNLGPEIAHYCAWFAPGVRCAVDSRWSLFADEAPRVLRAKVGLAVNEQGAWLPALKDHNPDYVTLSNFSGPRDSELAGQLWRNELHWRQKYADGRTVVFTWSGPDKTFAGEFRVELNRLAFGRVPDPERAPAKAPTWPTEDASVWSSFWPLYLEGPEPFPLAGSEAKLWQRYYVTMATSWPQPFRYAYQVARFAEPAGLGFMPVTHLEAIKALELPSRIFDRGYPNGRSVLKTRDFGPPAAALLIMRRARQAVAESPNAPGVYLVLSDACKTLMNFQEDYWANYRGDRPMQGLRTSLRQVQIVTALTTYLDLRPDDAPMHEQVGKIFLQLGFFDLALEHLQQAALHFDQVRPNTSDPNVLDDFKNRKKAFEKRVSDLEIGVSKRRDEYRLAATARQGLDKFQAALENERGLVQEAVKELQALKPNTLSPQENEVRDFALVDHLLRMGRASYLGSSLGARSPRLRALHAAALGNYGDLDRALGDMEIIYRTIGAQTLSREVVVNGFSQSILGQFPLCARIGSAHLSATAMVRTREELIRPEADLLTLRGIMMLEYGDTAAAHKHFQAAIERAGPDTYFLDRPIAVRYLELLREASAK